MRTGWRTAELRDDIFVLEPWDEQGKDDARDAVGFVRRRE
jgi:hypothetical protein